LNVGSITDTVGLAESGVPPTVPGPAVDSLAPPSKRPASARIRITLRTAARR
jgi:hypothetical protein